MAFFFASAMERALRTGLAHSPMMKAVRDSGKSTEKWNDFALKGWNFDLNVEQLNH